MGGPNLRRKIIGVLGGNQPSSPPQAENFGVFWALLRGDASKIMAEILGSAQKF